MRNYEDQLARANSNTYGIRAVFLRESLLPLRAELYIHSETDSPKKLERSKLEALIAADPRRPAATERPQLDPGQRCQLFQHFVIDRNGRAELNKVAREVRDRELGYVSLLKSGEVVINFTEMNSNLSHTLQQRYHPNVRPPPPLSLPLTPPSSATEVNLETGDSKGADSDSGWEEDEVNHPELDKLKRRVKQRMRGIMLEHMLEAKLGQECEPWDLSTPVGQEGDYLDSFLPRW